MNRWHAISARGSLYALATACILVAHPGCAWGKPNQTATAVGGAAPATAPGASDSPRGAAIGLPISPPFSPSAARDTAKLTPPLSPTVGPSRPRVSTIPADSLERWKRLETASLREIDSLQKQVPAGNLQSRLEWVGRQWIGRPYLLGPMGEGGAGGPEPKPRVRTDVFDCVTYIEQVEAFARSAGRAAYLSTLDTIRYRDGQPSYAGRNHWFESDWLPNNSRRVRLRHFPQDTVETRVLGRRNFYAEKGMAATDTAYTFRYLPKAAALAQIAGWRSEGKRVAGVGIVGSHSFIFVTHTGFLIEDRGVPPRIRHASAKGQVVEQDFRTYLEGRTSAVGIVVWDYLD